MISTASKEEMHALRHYAMELLAEFPNSPHIKELAGGRWQQHLYLTPFLDRIGDQIGKEAHKRPEDQHEAWVAASWRMHVEGYTACGSLTKVDEDIEKYARTLGRPAADQVGVLHQARRTPQSHPQGLAPVEEAAEGLVSGQQQLTQGHRRVAVQAQGNTLLKRAIL